MAAPALLVACFPQKSNAVVDWRVVPPRFRPGVPVGCRENSAGTLSRTLSRISSPCPAAALPRRFRFPRRRSSDALIPPVESDSSMLSKSNARLRARRTRSFWNSGLRRFRTKACMMPRERSGTPSDDARSRIAGSRRRWPSFGRRSPAESRAGRPEGFEHHRHIAEVLTAKLRKVVSPKSTGVLAPYSGTRS